MSEWKDEVGKTAGEVQIELVMKKFGATDVTNRRVREINAIPRLNVIGGCAETDCGASSEVDIFS